MESIVDSPREPGGRATVSELRARLGPVSLIRRQTEHTSALRALPRSLAPLAPALPMGGVQRGWSIGVDGHGGWALAMGLAGWLMEVDGWMAAVGLEDLGLVGAGEQGVPLDRVLMVETPPPDQWATVIAALVEAMHVVCVHPHHRIGRQEARRLQARIREQQAVLLHLDGGQTWPYPVDLLLTGRSQQWEGLGQGHGHLRGRRILVEVGGRRAPGAGQWVELCLDGMAGTGAGVVHDPARHDPANTVGARA